MFEGKKNTDKWFPVVLLDGTDLVTPEAGKVFGDVTCKYHAEAGTSQSAYSVTTDDWKEAGEGQYWLRIGASEFTAEGKYQVSVAVAGCATYRFVVEVTDETMAELINQMDTIISHLDSGTNSLNVFTELSDIEGKVDNVVDDLGVGTVSTSIIAKLSDITDDLGVGTVSTTIVAELAGIEAKVDAAIDDLGVGTVSTSIIAELSGIESKVDTAIDDLGVGTVSTTIVAELAAVEGKVDNVIDDLGVGTESTTILEEVVSAGGGSSAAVLEADIDGMELKDVVERLQAITYGRKRVNFPERGQTTYYKQDGVTPLLVMYDDINEREVV